MNESREGYILRTPVAKEFFTIENRQKTRWDAYLPGHGMIVTRVDSTNANIWSSNQVNCNPAHNYFELLRAGNTTSGDLSSDPFPGSTGNPMITNETAPSLRTWNGTPNEYILAGISETNGIISFNVMRESSLQMLIEGFETSPASSSTTAQNVEGDIAYWSFNKSGVRAPGPDKADGEHSVMMKLPSQFYSVTPLYYNVYQASLKVFNSGAYAAKYSLEYSNDNGTTWTKVPSASGGDGIEIPAKTTTTGYWSISLSNRKPSTFRISQVGGNKNAATYVDNFTIYYTGEEGGPSMFTPGDVNNDGEINIADINAVLDVILSGTADDDLRLRADVNEDGEINIADVNAIIGIILK